VGLTFDVVAISNLSHGVTSYISPRSETRPPPDQLFGQHQPLLQNLWIETPKVRETRTALQDGLPRGLNASTLKSRAVTAPSRVVDVEFEPGKPEAVRERSYTMNLEAGQRNLYFGKELRRIKAGESAHRHPSISLLADRSRHPWAQLFDGDLTSVAEGTSETAGNLWAHH